MSQSVMGFDIKKPAVQQGNEIEQRSLSLIAEECKEYPDYHRFGDQEKEVVKRLIHATTHFQDVISNIFFTDKAIETIKSLLCVSANIIVDTNMIKSGLSPIYTDKYKNKVICYTSEERVKDKAKENGTTRTFAAAQLALSDCYNQPTVLVCGNAPTFLYSLVESLLTENWDLSKVAVIAFPVGFVNVEESKVYTKSFLEHFNVEGIILEGRYGASTMAVSCLHAIYKLIK
ncbi:MAG: precorrin-8X methylmutase [bacterium]|nr:MAG: precorrin-8X methylmutase [bacterium]